MKIEIEKIKGGMANGFEISILRGWITINLPYLRIEIMTNRVLKEIEGYCIWKSEEEKDMRDKAFRWINVPTARN